MSESWSLWSFPGCGGRRTRLKSWISETIEQSTIIQISSFELREDLGRELREDGGKELRE